MNGYCARGYPKEEREKDPTLGLPPCKGPACEQWEDGPVKYCVLLVRTEKGVWI